MAATIRAAIRPPTTKCVVLRESGERQPAGCRSDTTEGTVTLERAGGHLRAETALGAGQGVRTARDMPAAIRLMFDGPGTEPPASAATDSTTRTALTTARARRRWWLPVPSCAPDWTDWRRSARNRQIRSADPVTSVRTPAAREDTQAVTPGARRSPRPRQTESGRPSTRSRPAQLRCRRLGHVYPHAWHRRPVTCVQLAAPCRRCDLARRAERRHDDEGRGGKAARYAVVARSERAMASEEISGLTVISCRCFASDATTEITTGTCGARRLRVRARLSD